MTNRLRILLLGPPQIHLDETEIHIQDPETRLCLCYLAIRKSPLPVEEIQQLFYEGQPESQAQERLEAWIGHIIAQTPLSTFLIRQPGMLGLDHSRIDTDYAAFQNLLDQAGPVRSSEQSGLPLPDSTVAALCQAVELWRSPRAMEGLEVPSGFSRLGTWLSGVRQRLERQYSFALQRLSNHARLTGDLEQSLAYARQALICDELNQDVHYQILYALVNLRRRSEAREHFAQLEQRLRQELDASPSPRLVSLYRQVREATTPLPGASRTTLPWRLQPTRKVPFVGRQEDLFNLRQAYLAGGGILVEGESGLGKTRLLQEFSHSIYPPPRVLLSYCRPAENNLPFQPLIEMLRQQIQPDEWLVIDATWASQLTQLLPELQTMRPDLEPPITEFAPGSRAEKGQELLFEAIRQAFLLLAQNARLLVCLDDAHWADEATLSAVTYLLERPPFTRSALFAILARPEEKRPQFKALTARFQQSSRLHLIRLQPLTVEEVEKVARHIFSAAPPPGLTERVRGDTGGNTFFVIETLHALKTSGLRLDQPLPDPLPIPESVQQLLQRRIDQLSPAARWVLDLCAVAGIEFDPEVIALAGPSSKQNLGNILQELNESLLVEPVADRAQDQLLRFTHSRVRDLLLDNIDHHQLRLLHGKVARAIEELSDPASAPAAILAYHFEQAGNWRRAFDYWLAAGWHASRISAHQEAVNAYASAERLLSQLPNLPDEAVYTLYSEWTEIAYHTEDAPTIKRLNQNMLQLGQSRGSSLLIGTAFNHLSGHCLAINQFEEGLELVEQAIPYLERSGKPHETMEAYNNRGVFLYFLSRVEEALESFQDALAVGADQMYADSRLLNARGDAHYQISFTTTLSGWPETGLRHALHALEDFTHANRNYGRVSALGALAVARYYLGDLAKAQQDARQGLDLAERVHTYRMLGYLHDYQAMIELDLGNLDAAWEHTRASLDLAERFGHDEIRSGALHIRGDLYYWLEDYQQASEYYRQAVQAGEGTFLAPNSIYRLGLATFLSDRKEEGLAHIHHTIESTKASGLGLILIHARMVKAITQALQEEWEAAEETAKNLLKDMKFRHIAAIRWRAINLLGEAALRAGRMAEAVEHFLTVKRESHSAGHFWHELSAERRLALAAAQHPGPISISDSMLQVQRLIDRLSGSTTNPALLRTIARFRHRVENKR